MYEMVHIINVRRAYITVCWGLHHMCKTPCIMNSCKGGLDYKCKGGLDYKCKGGLDYKCKAV